MPDARALEAELAPAVARLTGAIEQVPSSVSAIKVDGVRSYARVREGDEVELPARPVTVSRFDVLAVRPASVPAEVGPPVDVVDVDVEVDVSSGTYVRALARDLGNLLGVGGHLTALRRTRVGRFDLAQATRSTCSPPRPSATGATAYPWSRWPTPPGPSCPCTT